MRAMELVAYIQKIQGFKKIQTTSDLKSLKMITYIVTQGYNILTIGSGEDKRLKTLMGNKGSHNKAPVIGLCHRLFNHSLEFYVCQYTPGDGKFSKEERNIQDIFGEINIEGHLSYKDAMKFLRSKLNIDESSLESILLDLMETHGDILNHSLNTASTAQVVEELFGGYWKKSRNI